MSTAHVLRASFRSRVGLRFGLGCLALVSVAWPLNAVLQADEPLTLSRRVNGSPIGYTVVEGDSLRRLGSRFGIDPAVLARDNGLRAEARLAIGQHLRIDNRHIVPTASTPLVVNVPQRMLFFHEDEVVRAYPVGVGRPDWPTPGGEFHVVEKRVNPTWFVPQSIQDEMRRSGKAVIARMRPSPENPLGDRWLGLSIDSIGIHGTNAPASVYGFQTHGCIRLNPDDARELFDRVALQTAGTIVYEPALVAVVGDRVFVEVHRDIYRRSVNVSRTIADVVAREAMHVDWGAVARAVRAHDGIARDVTPAT